MTAAAATPAMPASRSRCRCAVLRARCSGSGPAGSDHLGSRSNSRSRCLGLVLTRHGCHLLAVFSLSLPSVPAARPPAPELRGCAPCRDCSPPSRRSWCREGLRGSAARAPLAAGTASLPAPAARVPVLTAPQSSVIGSGLGHIAEPDAGAPPPPPGQVGVNHDPARIGDRVVGADPAPPAQRLRQRLLDQVLGFLRGCQSARARTEATRGAYWQRTPRSYCRQDRVRAQPSSLHSLGLASLANCCTRACSSPSFLDRRQSHASNGWVNGRRSQSRATGPRRGVRQ